MFLFLTFIRRTELQKLFLPTETAFYIRSVNAAKMLSTSWVELREGWDFWSVHNSYAEHAEEKEIKEHLLKKKGLFCFVSGRELEASAWRLLSQVDKGKFQTNLKPFKMSTDIVME